MADSENEDELNTGQFLAALFLMFREFLTLHSLLGRRMCLPIRKLIT